MTASTLTAFNLVIFLRLNTLGSIHKHSLDLYTLGLPLLLTIAGPLADAVLRSHFFLNYSVFFIFINEQVGATASCSTMLDGGNWGSNPRTVQLGSEHVERHDLAVLTLVNPPFTKIIRCFIHVC